MLAVCCNMNTAQLKRHFVMERQNGYSVRSNRSTSNSIIDTWRLPLFSSSISLVVDNYQNIWLNSKRYNNRLLFPLFPFHSEPIVCLQKLPSLSFFFFCRLRFKPISYWFYFVCVYCSTKKKKWAVKPPSEIIIKLKARERKKNSFLRWADMDFFSFSFFFSLVMS